MNVKKDQFLLSVCNDNLNRSMKLYWEMCREFKKQISVGRNEAISEKR